MGNSGSSEDESVKDSKEKKKEVQKAQHHRRSRRRGKRLIQIGKIAVSIIKGSILEQTTDVIVVSCRPSLELIKARTTKLLLDSAGESIQDECKEQYPSGITFGDVAVIGPGKLDCQHIFLVTIQKYGNPADIKNLEICIQNCLAEASKLGMTSVAFQSLGAGFLGYPANAVATSMLHAVENFDTLQPKTSLRLVSCVVFDVDIFKNILAEAKLKATSKGLEALSLVTRASCSASFGKVHISVMVDTITTQSADVIVCTCAPDLKLASRTGLSKSIADAAGQRLQSEIDNNHPSGISTGDLVVSNGYRLKCRKVYIGCLSAFFSKNSSDQSPEQVLYNFVKKCLESASKHSCTSIAFPALGTGYLKFPPDLAASKVIQAIKDFQSKQPQTTLSEVKIVIFGGTNDWAKIEQAYAKYCQPQTGHGVPGPQQQIAIPQKGTRAYFKWKYREDPRPPKYWSHFKSSKTIKEWNTTAKGSSCKREQPDAKIVQSITNAFINTMDKHKATVRSIERVENISLFEQYAHECQYSFRKASVNGASIPLANTKGSRGAPDSMGYIDSEMKKHLHPEINEVFLFHGTKRSLVDVITQQGFDDRLAKMNFGHLRLGNGIYSAEEAFVSHGYTDQNGNCKMFLMRVNLGDVFTTPKNIENLTRPPCKSGCIGVCTNHPELYDSVVGDWPGYCREFTVYDRAKCYPEYIITYTIP